MTERFVESAGTISVANGSSTVVGTGTTFSGRDRAGAKVYAYPASSAPICVGTVAEVDPRGIYDDLSLPLVHAYNGAALTNVNYELVDGPAIANSATQSAIYARFAALLEAGGLCADTGGTVDFSAVPNNTPFVDPVTRVLYRWHNGVLEPIYTIGLAFNPRGAYDAGTSYAKNDMLQVGNYVYISNEDSNLGNTPDPTPASNAHWTFFPTATVAQVVAALGVHSITISTSDPSGGVDTDLWLKVV